MSIRTLLPTVLRLALGLASSSGFSQTVPALPQETDDPAAWEALGDVLWDAARAGKDLGVPTVGAADFAVSAPPANIELQVERRHAFVDAEGREQPAVGGSEKDPIDPWGHWNNGGTFYAARIAPPFDHDAEGKPLGLEIAVPEHKDMRTLFNRIGIRFHRTPAGRLLFLAQLGRRGSDERRWYASTVRAPIGGSAWRPPRSLVERQPPDTHLVKLLVLQLEPPPDVQARLPAKLQRKAMEIHLDAAAKGWSWEELKAWMAREIDDDLFPAGSTYVIQLPPGLVSDGGGLMAVPGVDWADRVAALSGGRKVWLMGHPDTYLTGALLLCDNLGLVFCRVTRKLEPHSDPEPGDSITTDINDRMLVLNGNNLDLRNNWIECPDGAAKYAISLQKAQNVTIVDNILSGVGGGVSTGGTAEVQRIVIARNWIERAFDAIQMYGGWQDAVIAYNHFAGASGYPNREKGVYHFGGSLHVDGIQRQANVSTLHPIRDIHIFGNFEQYGRHNWPARWYELGGGAQDIIVDGDRQQNVAIWWNIFQNLAPPGHRGVGVVPQDRARALATGMDKSWSDDYAVMGNIFLPRWDHNNHRLYGYVRSFPQVSGRRDANYELTSVGNVVTRFYGYDQPIWFYPSFESRPDSAAVSGWREGWPRLDDAFAAPLTYTGNYAEGYRPDFGGTAHEGHRLLHGWQEATDYAPKPAYRESPGGNPLLIPAAELEKVAPMPTDLRAFLGDETRPASYFEEAGAVAVAAERVELDAPWAPEAEDNGFLFHVKFGSVGTPGTHRALLEEREGGLRYELALTENDTALFRLVRGEEVLSRVESEDTFRDGDHLTVQVFTDYHPLAVEPNYPFSLLHAWYVTRGTRRVHYLVSDTPPPAPATAEGGEFVWFDPSDRHRSHRWFDGAWRREHQYDAIHACAYRALAVNDEKNLHRRSPDAGLEPIGSPEHFRRDDFDTPRGRWMTLYLDGPDEDSGDLLKEGDLLWRYDGARYHAIYKKKDGRLVGIKRAFQWGLVQTGRPRCFLRRNLEHMTKRNGWRWTPDVDLPRGRVTLFGGFDGTFESVRVIRGGQGQFGLPPNDPGYRALETIGAVMSFLREPLDEQGSVPGWGTPDLTFAGDLKENRGRGGNFPAAPGRGEP